MNFKAGDIIFFSSDGTNPIIDTMINFVSERTHVGMFVDDHHFIEAQNPKGVVKSKFDPAWKHVTVYRPLVSDAHIQKAVSMAHEHLGDKYSVLDSIVSGLLRILGLTEIAEKIDRNWNCSEFIGYLIRYGMNEWVKQSIPTQKILPDDLESEAKRLMWPIIPL